MADEEIWDSWEDLADSSDLDKHVNQYLKLSNGETDNTLNQCDQGLAEDSSNSFENENRGQFRILQRPVVHEEDQNRTAYIPQVKILRRPGKDSQSEEEKNKSKHAKSQPARTLAEREAAYAEARKRIMGSETAAATAQSSPASSGKSRLEHRKTRSNKSPENTVTVDRMPRGPDKTKGFSAPR